jgi:PAS domain S-box-containing protein
MPRYASTILKAAFGTTLAACIASLVQAAEQGSGQGGGFSYLKSDEVIITLLASTVLLLAGVLFRLRQMRIKLEEKTVSLEKSEQHIRLMGDNLPNVTIFQLAYANNGTFRFTYLSKGYERALGFDRDQAMQDAQVAYDNVYETDIPLLKEAFRQSTGNLEPVDIELRILDLAGQLKWLRISAVPHNDKGLLVWDGFMQDISTNKCAEEALLQENRNFQNLFDTIKDFLVVCDMNGTLIHTNPTVINRLGYTPGELADMSIFELYPEESRNEIYQMIARMQKEKATTCGLPLQMKSGSLVLVDMNVFQGSWKNKQAIFGVARDIANRQRIESALRESQQMLQLIMDTIPLAVFWKDKDSVYLGGNKAFIRDCGVESLDQIIGKTPFDLFDAAKAPLVIANDQDVIANNHSIFNYMDSYTRPDGSIGWREISKIPLRNDADQAVGVLGVWRDVTEQNRAEERLKRTLEDMERFNQLMRGRERRTLELKAEINKLLRELGKSHKYRTTTDDLP